MKNIIIFFFLCFNTTIFAQDFLSKCCTTTVEIKKATVVWLGNTTVTSGYYETFTYQVVAQDMETLKYYTRILDNVNSRPLGLMQFITLDDTWIPMDTTKYIFHKNGMNPNG